MNCKKENLTAECEVANVHVDNDDLEAGILETEIVMVRIINDTFINDFKGKLLDFIEKECVDFDKKNKKKKELNMETD